MLAAPMDVLKIFPVRKSKQQKQSFRDAVCAYLTDLGYSVTTEKAGMGVRNVVIGDPDKASYVIAAHYDTCAGMLMPNMVTPCNWFIYGAYQIFLLFALIAASAAVAGIICFATGFADMAELIASITYCALFLLMILGPANVSNANDNTSGVVTLLEIARTMPEKQRSKVCFVLFDLEEAGLLGSSAYRKAHKNATNQQIVINMDCVGDGDHILFMPTNKLKKDTVKLSSFYKVCGYFGDKSVLVKDKGYCFYPSDQANFPYGMAVAAFHKKKWVGHYYSRIHTSRDTVLEETNVNILRAALTTLVCGDAVQ